MCTSVRLSEWSLILVFISSIHLGLLDKQTMTVLPKASSSFPAKPGRVLCWTGILKVEGPFHFETSASECFYARGAALFFRGSSSDESSIQPPRWTLMQNTDGGSTIIMLVKAARPVRNILTKKNAASIVARVRKRPLFFHREWRILKNLSLQTSPSLLPSYLIVFTKSGCGVQCANTTAVPPKSPWGV